MSDVYVLGVDMIKFGRFPDRTVPNIGAEAALMALDDAGLTIKDMQAMYCGNLGQANAMVGQRILQEIGQTGIPVVNCSNACATGATAFREAWTSIKAGLYDVVLAVGVEQMGSGLLGGAGGGVGRHAHSHRRQSRRRVRGWRHARTHSSRGHGGACAPRAVRPSGGSPKATTTRSEPSYLSRSKSGATSEKATTTACALSDNSREQRVCHRSAARSGRPWLKALLCSLLCRAPSSFGRSTRSGA